MQTQVRYYEATVDPYGLAPSRAIVRDDGGRPFSTFFYVTGSVKFRHWGKDYDRPLMGAKVGLPVLLVCDVTNEIPPVLRPVCNVSE